MTDASSGQPISHDIDAALEGLAELEGTVHGGDARREVRRVRRIIERTPGSRHIRKYTTRDVAEGFIGGLVFSLPLLVEDGVFDIAAWFAAVTIGPLPIFLTAHVLFIVAVVSGLLYYSNIRRIHIQRVGGIVPRRLVAILCISFAVASLMMFLWGRLHEGGPSHIEALGRITVIWTAAALGATLGDILPGESVGTDIRDLLDSIGPDRSEGSTITER